MRSWTSRPSSTHGRPSPRVVSRPLPPSSHTGRWRPNPIRTSQYLCGTLMSVTPAPPWSHGMRTYTSLMWTTTSTVSPTCSKRFGRQSRSSTPSSTPTTSHGRSTRTVSGHIPPDCSAGILSGHGIQLWNIRRIHLSSMMGSCSYHRVIPILDMNLSSGPRIRQRYRHAVVRTKICPGGLR